MPIIFILLIILIFYSYIGYALLLFVLLKLKQIFQLSNEQSYTNSDYPEVMLVIPAYNELFFIDKKMENTFQLNYPNEKLKIIWITDGSNDGSETYIQQKYIEKYKNKYPIQVLHQPERKGKSAAINRAMKLVDTEIIIFCDANTILNTDCIKNIVQHFENPKTACVAGEKRVLKNDSVAGEGESFYWQYESLIKKLNSKFHTCIGAVGEIMAFKKSLFQPIPDDTILDDFVISMQMTHQGYKVVYEPNAYAEEASSANESEEMKRKIRIASGAFQCLFRYPEWLNFLKHPVLSFQYLSHKVSRWMIVPFSLPVIFILNSLLFFIYPDKSIYAVLLFMQLCFYSIVIIQHFSNLSSKLFRIPYYIIIMNIAMYIGLYKYITGKHSAIWEKVERKKLN